MPESTLRRWYHEYRHRQARRLLSLLPRDAVRPLYREARARVAPGEGPIEDPLALLLEFCQGLLPLPGFRDWKSDFAAHPAAHLDEMEEPRPAGGPTGGCVMVARRSLDIDRARWDAVLNVRRNGETWTGHIAFLASVADGGPPAYRTGEIFREASAEEVRARFLEFDRRTLRAFFRSVLP